MTPSEELESRIFRFAESAGKANWRATNLPLLSNAVQFHEDAVLVDALIDLHARAFMEFRQWSNERNGWVQYAAGSRQYFYREFQMRVRFSGRKYFERLEIQSKESARPVLPQRSALPAAEEGAAPPTRTRTPTAFVSHATQDHPFVEKFAADLRAHGVDAWFSKWEIKPGDSIRAKIEEGLEGCEYFIVVLSKSSIGRPWVQTELDAATVRKLNGNVRKIIPVKIEDCGDLPPTLASLCWEDFSNQPYEAALNRVLTSIFEVDVRPPLGKPQIGEAVAEIASQERRLQLPKDVELRLDFKTVSRGDGNRHHYRLKLVATNTGTERLTDYWAELQFPKTVLLGDPTISGIIKFRETLTHVFLRADRQVIGVDLYPGDPVEIMPVEYYMDHNLYHDGRVLSAPVIARFGAPGMGIRQAEKPFRDLQQF
jgi:hypothetical protein